MSGTVCPQRRPGESRLRRWLAGIAVLVAVTGTGRAHALTVDELLCSPEEWHVDAHAAGWQPPSYNGLVTRCGPLRFRHRGSGRYARENCEYDAAWLTRRCRENMDARVERGPDGEERLVWTLSAVVARHWNDCAIINARGNACQCVPE